MGVKYMANNWINENYCNQLGSLFGYQVGMSNYNHQLQSQQGGAFNTCTSTIGASIGQAPEYFRQFYGRELTCGERIGQAVERVKSVLIQEVRIDLE